MKNIESLNLVLHMLARRGRTNEDYLQSLLNKKFPDMSSLEAYRVIKNSIEIFEATIALAEKSRGEQSQEQILAQMTSRWPQVDEKILSLLCSQALAHAWRY